VDWLGTVSHRVYSEYSQGYSAHEGTLSTNVNTSRARSPACDGGVPGAAVAVVPVRVSAAGGSAAREHRVSASHWSSTRVGYSEYPKGQLRQVT
jgi:hypothetical protein